MVDADGQVLLIHIPEELEDIFRQKARVGEDQRGAMRADRRHDLRHGPGGGMAAPRDAGAFGSITST
jgi:hypothetical protein